MCMQYDKWDLVTIWKFYVAFPTYQSEEEFRAYAVFSITQLISNLSARRAFMHLEFRISPFYSPRSLRTSEPREPPFL